MSDLILICSSWFFQFLFEGFSTPLFFMSFPFLHLYILRGGSAKRSTPKSKPKKQKKTELDSWG